MNTAHIETQSLRLIPRTREEVRAQIEQMQPQEKAELSEGWLARLDSSGPVDPWIHGFVMVNQVSESVVGFCGFKGPPEADGMVEIAYGVAPEHQGKGYATEAAQALTNYAFSNSQVSVVRAHTLPQPNASTRVLTKCGFRRVGEVNDPEDGVVWRWEKLREVNYEPTD
jgi:RimJ/RimL family protein N-acetyltransferase